MQNDFETRRNFYARYELMANFWLELLFPQLIIIYIIIFSYDFALSAPLYIWFYPVFSLPSLLSFFCFPLYLHPPYPSFECWHWTSPEINQHLPLFPSFFECSVCTRKGRITARASLALSAREVWHWRYDTFKDCAAVWSPASGFSFSFLCTILYSWKPFLATQLKIFCLFVCKVF